MINTREVDDLCVQLNAMNRELYNEQRSVDNGVMELIADIAARISAEEASTRAVVPPPEFRDLLLALGWVLYRASMSLIRKIRPAWGIGNDESSAESAELIAKLADAARILPWGHFAPQSLGAIRGQALAESLRDTPAGYSSAWAYHDEAADRAEDYELSLSGLDKTLTNLLQQTFVQLRLSKTGTACREAEQVIGRWAEGLADEIWRAEDQNARLQRLYRQLSIGAATGERTLAEIKALDLRGLLADMATETTMATVTSYRNPGIMTTRALLLLAPLCVVMEELGLRPMNAETWADEYDSIIERAERAYRLIEDSSTRPFADDHLRSLIQLRLNFALIAPGRSALATSVVSELQPTDLLDDATIAALSARLEETKADGNVIASVTMPRYFQAIEECRSRSGAEKGGYRTWRAKWRSLDRYVEHPGRSKRIDDLLSAI